MEFPFLPSNPPKRVSLRLMDCGCERGRRWTANRGLNFDELPAAQRRSQIQYYYSMNIDRAKTMLLLKDCQ